jgi:mono/diheme cytochrome c family protein
MTMCALLFSAALPFGQAGVGKDAAITPVTGESWLQHLHRSFDESSMGKTWRLGPLAAAPHEAAPRLSLPRSETNTSGSTVEVLHGADLYRVNCQGCHGEDGRGAPPEIASLIDPVRATSVLLVKQRMTKVGMQLSHQQLAEMVTQSKSALLKRLHEGGRDMPSFDYLSAAEIHSLFAYLEQLANVPGTENEQVAVPELHARVGELIVKSTCHTCHGATGVNPTPADFLQGAIPPLSAFPQRVNQAQLVRKVTMGAPMTEGTTSSLYRSRMPVFSYLSANEAADVYEYLTRYPPTDLAGRSQDFQTSQPDPANLPGEPAPTASARRPVASQVSVLPERSESFVWLIGLGLFAGILLALGSCITLHEFRRLSARSQLHLAARRPGIGATPWFTLQPTVDLVAAPPSLRAESVEHKQSDYANERRISQR